jgi:hypothetical protein
MADKGDKAETAGTEDTGSLLLAGSIHNDNDAQADALGSEAPRAGAPATESRHAIPATFAIHVSLAQACLARFHVASHRFGAPAVLARSKGDLSTEAIRLDLTWTSLLVTTATRRYLLRRPALLGTARPPHFSRRFAQFHLLGEPIGPSSAGHTLVVPRSVPRVRAVLARIHSVVDNLITAIARLGCLVVLGRVSGPARKPSA